MSHKDETKILKDLVHSLTEIKEILDRLEDRVIKLEKTQIL
jgi:hypothetical protein